VIKILININGARVSKESKKELLKYVEATEVLHLLHPMYAQGKRLLPTAVRRLTPSWKEMIIGRSPQ
jgi:hypothetical protein